MRRPRASAAADDRDDQRGLAERACAGVARAVGGDAEPDAVVIDYARPVADEHVESTVSAAGGACRGSENGAYWPFGMLPPVQVIAWPCATAPARHRLGVVELEVGGQRRA